MPTVARGTVEIAKDRCKQCGYCIEFCPKHILAFSKDRNARGYRYATLTDEGQCTGCAMCARMCPDLVFDVYRS